MPNTSTRQRVFHVTLSRVETYEATIVAPDEERAEDLAMLQAPGDPRRWSVLSAQDITPVSERPRVSVEQGAIEFL